MSAGTPEAGQPEPDTSAAVGALAPDGQTKHEEAERPAGHGGSDRPTHVLEARGLVKTFARRSAMQ